MDWIERLNCAISYIEENLEYEIDMDEVGRIAGCSSYHFQRMFSYMADMSLADYLRKRRMSLAAVELMSENPKVMDVALKYGYESPTAFNRAFKKIHGVAPSKIVKKGVTVKAFPPIQFHMTIKGSGELNYRFEKRKAFEIIGISTPLEKELEKNYKTVPRMWRKAGIMGTIPKLVSMMNTDIKGVLGVSICDNGEDWKYYIAVASTLEKPEQMEKYEVPACTWVIFHGEGTNTSIQELQTRIVKDWLPTSGYEYANAPDIEVYLNSNPKKSEYEVWVPVIKK